MINLLVALNYHQRTSGFFQLLRTREGIFWHLEVGGGERIRTSDTA